MCVKVDRLHDGDGVRKCNSKTTEGCDAEET